MTKLIKVLEFQAHCKSSVQSGDPPAVDTIEEKLVNLDPLKLVHYLRMSGGSINMQKKDVQLGVAESQASTLLTVLFSNRLSNFQCCDYVADRLVALSSDVSAIVCSGKAVEFSKGKMKLGWRCVTTNASFAEAKSSLYHAVRRVWLTLIWQLLCLFLRSKPIDTHTHTERERERL